MTADGPSTSIQDLVWNERPLEGLRVLGFGSLIAGLFATRVMAEFGAEVIEGKHAPDVLRPSLNGMEGETS